MTKGERKRVKEFKDGKQGRRKRGKGIDKGK